jgi:hypothetical protein
MSSTPSAEFDLTRFATAEEIAEAESETGAPRSDQPGPPGAPVTSPDPAAPPGVPVTSPDPVVPDPGPIVPVVPDAGPIIPVDAVHPPGVWLPNTVVHPIGVIDRGPRQQTRGIVIHVNDGFFDGTISWFTGGPTGSKGVGAHLEIGDDRVWQLASLDRKCWHAVNANAFSIGFEHVGFGKQSRADWLHASHELAFSANRASWVLHEYQLGEPSLNHNIWPHSFGGAAWGGHDDCPGAGFPWKEWLAMCHDAYQAHWGRPN